MFSKKFLLIQAIFIMVLGISLFLLLSHKPKTSLPVLGTVNSFALTSSEGKNFGSDNLSGNIWVADFFFTTCSSICPMMSAHMGRLAKAFKGYPQVKLVSISVNPENDSPEALKKYALKFHADPNQWVFLTGSREDITKVVVGSFKLGDMKEPVFHSSYFTLVDKQGKIRGYYDSNEPKNIDKIITDLKQLLKSQ